MEIKSSLVLSGDVDHNPLADRSDSLSVCMGGNVAPIDTAVRFRLSPAQIDILKPGIDQISRSYQARLRDGISPFSYPFRIYPLPRDFDRGSFNQPFMDNILCLGERWITKTKTRKSVQMDTFQLRAAVFAIRAYIDFARLLRRQNRSSGLEVKARLHIDDKSFAQLKAKSQSVIHSLERHMKRANRALMTTVGKKQFTELTVAWKAHLRWMRLRVAYCKPWAKPDPNLRKQQQRNIDDLVQMAKRGLRNAGYQAPEENDLRHIIRLYARYARGGRQGHWTVRFMLANKASFTSTYYLAQFVIERSKLKELSKS
jgi:hypothetical protein